MCEDRVAECGIRHSTDHRNLHACHNLACTYAERHEPEDAIAIPLHQTLQESARFHESARTQNGSHRNLEETVGNSFGFGLFLRDTDTRTFRI